MKKDKLTNNSSTGFNLNTRRWSVLILLLVLVTLVSGCADSISLAEAALREEVGFWYGLWHGIICPIAFIISLFDSDVAIYAIYNNGTWYDFGFVLGVVVIGGGSKATN